MKFRLITAVVLASAMTAAAQTTTAPTLTSEEAIMVEAVRTVQAQAQAECEALPAVKRYTALLQRANGALEKAGKAVNWSTGAVSAAKPAAKPEPKR